MSAVTIETTQHVVTIETTPTEVAINIVSQPVVVETTGSADGTRYARLFMMGA